MNATTGEDLEFELRAKIVQLENELEDMRMSTRKK
jgi:hypothetical protein